MYTVITQWAKGDTREYFATYREALNALDAPVADATEITDRYIVRDCESCYGDGEVIADSGVSCPDCSGTGDSYLSTDVLICRWAGTFGSVIEPRSSWTYEIVFHDGSISKIVQETTFEVGGSYVDIWIDRIPEIRETLELIGRADLLPFAPEWTNADLEREVFLAGGFEPPLGPGE